jgi:hypothetical protein
MANLRIVVWKVTPDNDLSSNTCGLINALLDHVFRRTLSWPHDFAPVNVGVKELHHPIQFGIPPDIMHGQ